MNTVQMRTLYASLTPNIPGSVPMACMDRAGEIFLKIMFWWPSWISVAMETMKNVKYGHRLKA